MIKPKTGICTDCPPGSKEVPLIARRCQKHYWQHRASLKGEKAGNKPRNSPIAKKSANQIDREIEYAKKRKKWLTENQICKAHLTGCQVVANQVHHKQGRIGDLLLDESKWLAVCHHCHTWITVHSSEAIELGFSLKRNV